MRGLALLMVVGLAACEAPPQLPEGPTFLCVGAEPFWKLEVGPDTVMLSYIGESAEPIERQYTGTWRELDEEEGIFFWQGGVESEGFDVTISRAECQGSYDEPYAYQSSYGTGRPNGVFEPGCCSRQ